MAAASAQECPEHQNPIDPAWQPVKPALQEQPISSCRRTIASAFATQPAQGHTEHESGGSTDKQKSASTMQLESGACKDIAAQDDVQADRFTPAGSCPTSKASGRCGRPSAFAAAASAQEHTYLHNAFPTAPQPASKDVQTQPRQTPFAAVALAQSSPRSAEEVLGAPAALDTSPWASAEAPAAMCAAAALRARSAGPLRSPLPRQLSFAGPPSHDRVGQDGQRTDFLRALEEACRQGLTLRLVLLLCCIATNKVSAWGQNACCTFCARPLAMPGFLEEPG